MTWATLLTGFLVGAVFGLAVGWIFILWLADELAKGVERIWKS